MAIRGRARRAMVAVLTAAGVTGAAQAQAPDPGWRSFVSVSPVFEEADLDRGGDFSVGGAILRAGASRGFGADHRAGVTLNYDYFDYSFGNPAAFGGVAPWDKLQRYGISLPSTFALRDGWRLGITPSFDRFEERGAKSSDALAWGGTFAAVKRFADGNVVGLGLAAFNRIEETSVAPFLVVDWRFGRSSRLINPLAAGPTGPAGLQLDYLFDNGWTVGVGAAWRRIRYRLSEGGPVPNGVGEISGAPVFLRASREFVGIYTLNLYAGAVAAGALRVEDPRGNLLREDEFDLAPFAGVNVTVRF
ncbi:MAG: hypothetical protein M5U08_22330 [Burkholderiales bacterium]|nr:hypothetical protein [Burkholderiales bacterium]